MDKNRISYNAICEAWSEYRNKSKINQCIVEFTRYLKPNSLVLDVGCGSGYPIASYLVDCGFEVIGIDVSEKMIERSNALQLVNSKFLVSDILDFKSEKEFDAIIAFDSLWHIPLSKQSGIYGVISSLLNVGGYLLFTHGKHEGTVVGEMFNEEFIYSALDKEKVRGLLEENGFEIVSWMEDYEEETTGDRELLVIAKKIKE